jgi:hypothetical protein
MLIDFSGNINCNTFSAVPYIIIEIVKNVLFHCYQLMTYDTGCFIQMKSQGLPMEILKPRKVKTTE